MSAPAWVIEQVSVPNDWRDIVWETYFLNWDVGQVTAFADVIDDEWGSRKFLSPHAAVDHWLKTMEFEEFIAYYEEVHRE